MSVITVSLMVIAKVLLGIAIGSSIAIAVNHVNWKSTISKLSHDSYILRKISEEDSSYIYYAAIEGDCIGDDICTAVRDYATSFAIISFAGAVLIGPFLLDTYGAVALVISYSICRLLVPKIEEYRYTIAHIEDTIEQVHPEVRDIQKASRKVYKALKSWLKPNVGSGEFFIMINIAVDYYLSEYYSKQRILTLPDLEP